jgi:cytoskeletal protein CcmA (bactofilin family)
MFQKKMKPDQVDTVIGAGSRFQGDIEATGMVRVDGVFLGNIRTEGNIVIGEKAIVEGNIQGLYVTIAGKVQGKVNARTILQLHSTAQVIGDLEVEKMMVEEGAIFEGQCKMNTKTPEEKPQVNQAS